MTRRCCKDLTLLYRFFFWVFAIRICSFLTLHSYLEKSISFHVLLCLAEDAHSAFACFFISFKFYNRFTKNYPAEVCLLSHEVTFKPLSSALHGSFRFLRNPLPAPRLAFLAIGLPTRIQVGETTGLPSSIQVTDDWLRVRLSTGSMIFV